MKKILTASLLIVSIFVFFNCSKKSNVKAEFSLITRNEYIEKLKTKLNEWSINLDKLDTNVQKLSGKAKLKADEQLRLIRIQQDSLKKILGEIQNSEDNAWLDFKRGADSGSNKINRAFFKANAQYN